MNKRAVLFDMDGTLLPMDAGAFAKAYFKGLSAELAPRGYEPKMLIDGVWKGTAAMVKNDGKLANEKVFWREFAGIFGERVYDDVPYFDEFYKTSFGDIREVCGYNEKASKLVKSLKNKGYTIVLATNPFFPMIGQERRLSWTGVDRSDVDYITSYENSHYCKPNLDYYREILSVLGLDAQNCVMVGNDVGEDMVAKQLGIKVFLLTDCLINSAGKDIDEYPHGGFDELTDFLEKLTA